MTTTCPKTAAKPAKRRKPAPTTSESPTRPADVGPATRHGPPPETAPPPQIKGKLGVLVGLLRQDGGATLAALSETTGWQNHSVRGAISGALKTKHGLTVTSEKIGGERVYRIPADERE